MYILRNSEGYLAGWGTGIVLEAPAGLEALYSNLSIDEYANIVTSRADWGGDWRFVLIGNNGLPAGYQERPLTPEEVAANEAAADEAEVQAAKDAVAAMPGWSSWTPTELDAWVDAEVIDLATAKVAIKELGHMVLLFKRLLLPYLSR